jgi:hypothetical protein
MSVYFTGPVYFHIAATVLALVVVPAAVLFFVLRELLRIEDNPRAGLISGVVAVVASLVLLALIVLMPYFESTHHHRISKLNGIISNLRILDGAKQQWAFEHHRTGAVEVTREDIAAYLRGPAFEGWVQPVAGEQYVLKTLIESPEAKLTCMVDGRPEGTRIRLLPDGTQFSVGRQHETNWGCEIILPNQGTAPSQNSAH